MRITFGGALLALLACLGGCANIGVKPWERSVLARDDMQIVSEPLEASLLK